MSFSWDSVWIQGGDRSRDVPRETLMRRAGVAFNGRNLYALDHMQGIWNGDKFVDAKFKTAFILAASDESAIGAIDEARARYVPASLFDMPTNEEMASAALVVG